MDVSNLQLLSADFATAYREQQARIEAERLTLAFRTPSNARLDTGRQPIEESPLFGGSQLNLFEEAE
jgi:hypothetical protein